ncbi:hypothetical protein B0H17DRAFT_1041361 [Mycena rosella]|uniref:BAG domain-containing protein n=1 Tax=Mycena rosella TaxID=1033263 RepID=A0AAD7GNL5_MYCRO|nr:hypothetical protein B0H17DRAFT_1041361 [Mycena rosella]
MPQNKRPRSHSPLLRLHKHKNDHPMTQDSLPVLIPHHLVHEILDKSAGNWPIWEKTVLACLILVGLDGYPAGTVPYPDPAADPAGAANWHTNDRAVVSFLALKASRNEQAYIASHAAGGAKVVWDALVARHFDTGAQICLIREAFGIRYDNGVEPPALTSARIDALAARIFALGPISKTTLISAVMVNAVQGDIQNLNFAQDPHSNRTQPDQEEHMSQGEQDALLAVTAELTTLRRDLSPAVLGFIQRSSAHESNEAEWTHLLENLFQVLGRVDTIAITPTWDRAISARQEALDEVQRLRSVLEKSTATNAPVPPGDTPAYRVSEGEQNAMTVIATEMSKVQNELAPAIREYFQQAPDERQRSCLIELLIYSLVLLDGTTLEPTWEEGRTRRTRAVEELLRLLNTLEWSSTWSARPDHVQIVGQEEQTTIAHIAFELANIHNVLAPAVGTFPRPHALQNEQDMRHLTRLLFETVERLDATHIDMDWAHARNERRNAVKAVQQLQNTLDGFPTCTEEQATLQTIASERSRIQSLLVPAVNAYQGSSNERERVRISEMLFQALERLDGVALESAWNQARNERRAAVNEVQTLQNRLESPPPSNEPSTEQSGERLALSRIASERSKIQSELSPAIVLFVCAFQHRSGPGAGPGPQEKERLRLSELSLRFLERLDGVQIESDWEEARKERKSAVKEVLRLQEMLDLRAP